MTTQDKAKNERNAALANERGESPLFGEGHEAKPMGGTAANNELPTTCNVSPAEFRLTDPCARLEETPITALVAALPPPSKVLGGRPAALTPEMMRQICLLLSWGLSRRKAALFLDVDPHTIARTGEREPDFARSMERAEQLALIQPHIVIAMAGQKDWRAAAWLLAHQAKHPAPLTEDEKLQAHQERMADKRRLSEYFELSDKLLEERDEAAKARQEARELATSQAKYAKMFPPRKRRAKTKSDDEGKESAV